VERRRRCAGPPRRMTAETKNAKAATQFGLTLVQKILYGLILVAATIVVVPLSPVFSGPVGT